MTAPASQAPSISRHILEPSRGWMSLNLGELWDYRDLLYFLAWRDVKVRYKQTVLGIAWAVLQPLLTMAVFTLLFSRLAKIPSDGVPYPVFAYCALLPWTLFVRALTEAGNSLVGNQNLITKVYFPRLVVPIAAVLSGLVDFAVSFLLMIVLMAWYGMVPTVAVIALPLFMVMALATSLGVGLWLSALNVQYRDIRYAIPFLAQLWLFLTPVAYPASLVPEQWRALFGLNPMAGVIEGFRWALLGTAPPTEILMTSVPVVVVLFVTGLYYFRRMESVFADVV